MAGQAIACQASVTFLVHGSLVSCSIPGQAKDVEDPGDAWAIIPCWAQPNYEGLAVVGLTHAAAVQTCPPSLSASSPWRIYINMFVHVCRKDWSSWHFRMWAAPSRPARRSHA